MFAFFAENLAPIMFLSLIVVLLIGAPSNRVVGTAPHDTRAGTLRRTALLRAARAGLPDHLISPTSR